ncbi:hypothetical protein WH47_00581 [Habropoda laboriosa]|uniref:Uncharacterized protein n=1 Tax=Habropoda laboriosa TaxID=597456 RepID=A0A0L7RI92_9HYME|nr:PREDICTED: uncharacterized protein LOC108575022 [Habropoda laboriosa]KOC70436.1 hypothetical protein WH47_00581 [Habropoda laboriosa]
MCSNYFEKLIIQARQFDNDIEKLSDTWKLPIALIGRFAECTEETNSHIEAIWSVIKNTQNGIEEILSEIKESKSEGSVNIEQFLQETKDAYESLIQECNNIESVLGEYGYHYTHNDSSDKVSVNSSTSINQHSVGNIETLEVEFTPNLSWKCKKKQKELIPAPNDSCVLRTFMTSISEGTPNTYKDYTSTPVRERPQEPIYSRHFYNILKK